MPTDDRELVERLRGEAERLSGHSIDRGSVDAGIASNLADEAAATIERLLARQAKLEKALTQLVDVVGNMRVPQNLAEAAVQVTLTIGPSLTNARQALGETP